MSTSAPIGTAFVTGGSGFVGRNLLRRLRTEGVAARALARSKGSADAVAATGAEAVQGDLDDAAALADGMRGCDVVFHCAAYVEDWDPEGVAWGINVDGTQRVLDAARAAGVRRVVHCGTEAVLADGHAIVGADEDRPYPEHPVGVYPTTKGEAERRVRAANGNGLETVVVRPRFVWGGDDTTLLPRFVELAKGGNPVWMGDGTHLTSTTHVDNAVHGLWLASHNGAAGGVWFVKDEGDLEVREFMTALLATQGVTPGKGHVPVWVARLVALGGAAAWSVLPIPGRPMLTPTAVALMGVEVTVKDDRARKELGYAPVITREQGFAALAGAPGNGPGAA